MSDAFSALGKAFKLWLSESLLLCAFNFFWLILQVLVITGPPATAALYAVGRRVNAGESLHFSDYWIEMRRMFAPAWKWGLVNGLLILVLLGNFLIYRQASGYAWDLLRTAWAVILVGWGVINQFYWPFWIYEKNRSMLNTLRNSYLFFSHKPILAIMLFVLGILIAVFSLVTVIPLALLWMSWLALTGLVVISEELEAVKGNQV